MDKSTHAVRAEHWRNIILQCQQRPVGMSAKQWLKENGISEQSYYLWQRKFRKQIYDSINTSSLPAVQNENELSFAEFKIQEQTAPIRESFVDGFKPAAMIKGTHVTVALTNDISDSLLCRILQEVSHA